MSRSSESIPFIVLIAVAGKSSPLEDTLNSLTKCIKPANYKATVIVENGLKYGIEQLVENYNDSLNIKYNYHPQGNKSAALNVALDSLQENHFIFMTDDDTTFDEKILVEYSQRAYELGPGHFFGGPMNVIYENDPPDYLLPYLPTSSKPWPSEILKSDNLQKFLGINWAAFSDDLIKAGGFNVNFGPGTIPRRTGQEHKMQEDLIRIGIKPIYIEQAKVWHLVPSNKCSEKFALSRQKQFGIMYGMKLSVPELILEIIKYGLKTIYHLLSVIRVRAVDKRLEVYANYSVLKGLLASINK